MAIWPYSSFTFHNVISFHAYVFNYLVEWSLHAICNLLSINGALKVTLRQFMVKAFTCLSSSHASNLSSLFKFCSLDFFPPLSSCFSIMALQIINLFSSTPPPIKAPL